MNLLKQVNFPKDIKNMEEKTLKQLAKEIRHFLIHSVSKTGGHLASNLGVVELTLALHYCFDLPKDKIVWDVGHQAYVHKLLTGRKTPRIISAVTSKTDILQYFFSDKFTQSFPIKFISVFMIMLL